MPAHDRGRQPDHQPEQLDARFEGACTLDIRDVQGGPPLNDYPLRCEIRFSADRQTVWLLGFDPIVSPEHQAQVGPLTVTNQTHVRLASADAGRLGRDGHVAIPVVLFFDHLFDMPFYEEDSHLPLTLRSDAPGGSPLDEAGRLTLVGEGQFASGALDGKRCRLTYVGRVSPMPW